MSYIMTKENSRTCDILYSTYTTVCLLLTKLNNRNKLLGRGGAGAELNFGARESDTWNHGSNGNSGEEIVLLQLLPNVRKVHLLVIGESLNLDI